MLEKYLHISQNMTKKSVNVALMIAYMVLCYVTEELTVFEERESLTK